MKVAIINTLYHPNRLGGAELSVQLLAEELVKNGSEVLVLTLHSEGIIRRDLVNGVNVTYLPLLNVYWPYNNKRQNVFMKLIWHANDFYNFRMIKSVENEIDLFQPDIVHTNNLSGFSMGIWLSLKKKGIHIVHTARDYYMFHPNSTLFKNGICMSMNNPIVRVNRYFKSRMSKGVDAFIGISSYVSELHKSYGFAPNGFHSFVYNPINKIEHNRVSDNKLTIGFIGRLTADKGFDQFINSAALYSDKFNFIAAGKPDASEQSEELVDKAIKCGVQVLGFVPAEIFFDKIDILLLPTKWNEPFGRVVAEAAVAGIPVYTNYIGGIKEIASFFEWVRDIKYFNEPEMNEIVKSARMSVIKMDNPFNINDHVSRYMEIYGKIIS
ncbi:glycosyltransferase [Klebsiella huaxiensis]|uniref:Glycosyltransferase family 4 protein n=1 Tax=Klebsiella huaxiensis TaxID=2153354 RepID=A0ABT6EFX2_9ENTR|nr:glycosyltransferase family 4 protein [Klebsiella huaxiensis]MDG1644319.1 glycosyltransferase family 4 protein [Klebsiella huaxiensis]QBG07461.1 glycosyltransferase [Klebsiella huaxiensis]VUS54974.1 hypothetical protein SB6425_00009 [Klebsiella huaxiensis]